MAGITIRSTWFNVLVIMHMTSIMAFTPLFPTPSLANYFVSQSFRGTSAPLDTIRASHLYYSAPTSTMETSYPYQLPRNSTNKKQSIKKSISKIKSQSNSYSQFYKEGILVGIERTSPNSRRISGEVLMDTSIDDIWAILTDYDNLNVHVPNLIESKVISRGGRLDGGKSTPSPRVHQKGAQRIFGFEFSADVTLEMKESIYHTSGDDYADDGMKAYSIDFQCVQSQFFSQFDGSWILEEYSRSKTMVRYIVDVMPKGPVPVAALEWRIKEDVPVNLLAVSNSAMAVSAKRWNSQQISQNEVKTVHQQQQQQQQQQQKTSHGFQKSPSPLELHNPIRQLTSLAAYSVQQTAKLILPAPLLSTTTERSLSVMNVPTTSTSIRQSIIHSSSLSDVTRYKCNRNNSESIPRTKANTVDWYKDETLATYLEHLPVNRS